MKRRDRLVRKYFIEGLTCSEISAKLALINSIVVNESTVKRTTKNLNPFRRKYKSNILNVSLSVFEAIDRSGGLHG